ncbi:LPXTG cell wall anchor domain-containing protein [Actinoplanes sp. TFC3]|uniref:LPXTG cell wall anchor domain-containing protein n=1 Tax=Actinoplanes sp. TFC3 TaxID=1710355 RepID=UPI00082C6662|nr:LPXTG cell wall anchor domain-containing protein [Actinoplanes sp. TFC3]
MKPLLHLAAGALLALTGIAATAAPASAAGPEITVAGAAICQPDAGEWQVTWTVTNSGTSLAKVDKLKAEPAAVPGLSNGTSLNRRSPSGVNGTTIFQQTVPGGTASASVSFVGIWADNTKDSDNAATVQLGDCKPAEAPCVQPGDAAFHHTFALAGGKATATVTLDGTVKLCDAEPVSLATYFAPKPQFSVPQYLFDSATQTISNENRSVELSADLPACNAQVDLFFGGEGDIIPEITEGGPRYGNRKLGSTAGLGGRSKGPQGWYNGGDKGCQSPAVEPVSRCDGTVTLNLSNTGELSRYAVDFAVKAGAFTKTVTVQPGQGETVTVPANAGTVTVTADGLADVTYDWTSPGDCNNGGGETPGGGTPSSPAPNSPAPSSPAPNSPIPSGSAPSGPAPSPAPAPGGDDGGLPVTGAAAGSIAAGALVLLIAGGVVFYLSRRKKVKFTA